jgi:hypothetical protein
MSVAATGHSAGRHRPLLGVPALAGDSRAGVAGRLLGTVALLGCAEAGLRRGDGFSSPPASSFIATLGMMDRRGLALVLTGEPIY